MNLDEVKDKIKNQTDEASDVLKNLLNKNKEEQDKKEPNKKPKAKDTTLDLLHDFEVGEVEKRLSDCQQRLKDVEGQNKQLLDHFLLRDKSLTDSINKLVSINEQQLINSNSSNDGVEGEFQQ